MADGQPDIPVHADFQQAPGLLEGATTIELAAEDCGLNWWIRSVAQGALVGLDRGKRLGSTVPAFLREPGPLRDNLTVEFAFRSLTEWEATRLCAGATVAAPDVATMEFYATQTLDEARHSQCFRDHLIDLRVPPDELLETVERVARPDADRLIKPLWEWGQPIYDAGRETGTYFIDTVAIVTILLEGVLAPTTELSELKWKPISPATADIERGACVDEIRHLSVGSSILRRHVQEHPDDKQRLVDLVADGRRLWAELPTPEIVYKREQMFQRGLEQHADVIGDYELTPGVRLVDTTSEDRMRLALEWSLDVQATRLKYMGLEEAMTSDVRI